MTQTSAQAPLFARLLDSFWFKLVFLGLSGVGLFTAFPTADIWPLSYVVLVPLIAVILRTTPWRAFGWGAWLGFVTNLGGFYWLSNLLKDFGHLDWWLAWLICLALVGYQGLVFAIWSGLVAYIHTRIPSIPAWAVLLPTFIAVEFLFPLLFPWFLGNSQYRFLPAIQIADVFGIWAISLFVLLINTLLYYAVSKVLGLSHRRAPRFLLVGFMMVALSLGYGLIRLSQVREQMAAAETLKIGLVEADIGIWEKEDPHKLDNNILIHQNLSQQLESEGVELVVWPESSYQSPYIWGSTADTEDLIFLELDSIFVPKFRDLNLLAFRILDQGLGFNPLHSPATHRMTHRILNRLARGAGFEQIPNSYPALCGESVDTHLACPFRRIPPDEVSYLLPGHAPLYDSKREDRAHRTLPWNQFAVQRGFQKPLLFGGITIRAPQGIDLSYKEILRLPITERELFNVALYLDEYGRVRGNYKKNHLLLFGESVPLADRFPWIYELVPEAGSFTPGTEVMTFDHEGTQIGVEICYEDILPSFSKRLARLEPQLVINVTNDAWFGKTSEPYLHLALSTIRSVESRTWLVRSTNTGVSAFIDATGAIVSETSIHDPEVLAEDVPIMPRQRTVYSYIGDILAWVSLGLTLFFLFLARFQPEEEDGEENSFGDENASVSEGSVSNGQKEGKPEQAEKDSPPPKATKKKKSKKNRA